MTFAFNLNAIASIRLPAGSANPVLMLKMNDGSVAWAKVAPGGERVSFANDVMTAVGFEKQGIRLYNKQDALDALAKIKFRVLRGLTQLHPDTPLTAFNDKLAVMGEALESPENSFLITEHVGGTGTLQSHLGDDEGNRLDENQAADILIGLLKNPKSQQDFARMMAADLLLGNFDRLGYANGMDPYGNAYNDTLLHTGNFILAATKGGFLPIDNDTVLPAPKHLASASVIGREVTQEDVYKTVILGGYLIGEGTTASRAQGTPQYIPNEGQSSMNELLGENGSQRIFELLLSKMPSLKKATSPTKQQTATIAQLRKISSHIAPLVRSTASQLVKELKQPGIGRKSLLETLRACQSVEAMNYSTFKVKSRFMALMTEAGNREPSNAWTQWAVGAALDYGKYRDWKDAFDRILDRDPKDVYEVVLTTSVRSGWTSLPTAQASADPSLALRNAANRLLTSTASTPADYKKAKALYLESQTTFANGTPDAKRRLAVPMMMQELAEIAYLIRQVTAPEHRQDFVAACFAKALGKRRDRVSRLLLSYQAIAEKFEKRSLIGSQRLAPSTWTGSAHVLSTSVSVVKPLVAMIPVVAT